MKQLCKILSEPIGLMKKIMKVRARLKTRMTHKESALSSYARFFKYGVN